MRKINVYSDSLLELFRKDFWQDAQKFIRAMTVTMDHVGVPFSLKNSEYALVGKVNDKELCCQKLDDKTMWAIEYRTVQDALLGKKRTVYEVNKMSKVEKPEALVETDDTLITEEEDLILDDVVIPADECEVPEEEVEVEDEQL